MNARRRKEQPEDPKHREMIMERLMEFKSPYVWCLHCERVYRREEVRWDPKQGIYLCAYEDCAGDAYLDAWSYAERREELGWPVEPERGVVYSPYK